MRAARKLKTNKGETLVETLLALLIIGLASVMLATMISAAVNINKTTKGTDELIYKAVSYMEGHTAAASDKNASLTGSNVIIHGVSDVRVKAATYKYSIAEDKTLVSYSATGEKTE